MRDDAEEHAVVPESSYKRRLLAQRLTEDILEQTERLENEPRVWVREMLNRELESMQRNLMTLYRYDRNNR